MAPHGGDPTKPPRDEPLPAPPTESDAPPERASLVLLFGAAAVALALLLAVIGLLAALVLKP